MLGYEILNSINWWKVSYTLMVGTWSGASLGILLYRLMNVLSTEYSLCTRSASTTTVNQQANGGKTLNLFGGYGGKTFARYSNVPVANWVERTTKPGEFKLVIKDTPYFSNQGATHSWQYITEWREYGWMPLGKPAVPLVIMSEGFEKDVTDLLIAYNTGKGRKSTQDQPQSGTK